MPRFAPSIVEDDIEDETMVQRETSGAQFMLHKSSQYSLHSAQLCCMQ